MNKYLFTSESVTEGHPDKLCDLVSDTILDECLKQDEYSRVAVETFASNDKITIAGQITTNAIINVEEIAKQVLKDIGYFGKGTDFDIDNCIFDINITRQSSDIAQGVDIGGAGDQGIMFGYACSDTEEYMPLAISLAHNLSMKLTEVRKSGKIPYLGADGKTQVTVEYENDIPKRVEAVLVSNQHRDNVSLEKIREDIIEKVIKDIIPAKYLDVNTKYYVNPTGRFVIRWTIRRHRIDRQKNNS